MVQIEPIDLVDMQCCGIRELNGLSAYAKSKDVVDSLYYDYLRGRIGALNFSTIVFSGVVPQKGQNLACRDYAKSFATFLTKHKLGPVVTPGISVNPNTGNRLRVYTWTINPLALEAYAKAHTTPRPSSDPWGRRDDEPFSDLDDY